MSMSASVLKRSVRPGEEIADARLSHAQGLGGSPLLEAASRDELLYLNHEIRSDQQAFGLLTAKSHITGHIPGRPCDLRFHIAHQP
jgi:hypothetical protein